MQLFTGSFMHQYLVIASVSSIASVASVAPVASVAASVAILGLVDIDGHLHRHLLLAVVVLHHWVVLHHLHFLHHRHVLHYLHVLDHGHVAHDLVRLGHLLVDGVVDGLIHGHRLDDFVRHVLHHRVRVMLHNRADLLVASVTPAVAWTRLGHGRDGSEQNLPQDRYRRSPSLLLAESQILANDST